MIITYILNKHIYPRTIYNLKGCILAITIQDLDKTWNIGFEDQIHIVDSCPDKIDVHITSTVAGFIKFVLQQDRSELHITGNLSIAESLQNVFSDLQIDWEEELSKYFGDVVSHQIIRIIDNLKHVEIEQMLVEYLQEEAKILPTKYEVNTFLNAVDSIRADVDRLDNKVRKYENNY